LYNKPQGCSTSVTLPTGPDDEEEPELKAKMVSADKADSLKHVWLNVNITTFTPKFTDVIKRHVNKYFYSIHKLCHNICTLV